MMISIVIVSFPPYIHTLPQFFLGNQPLLQPTRKRKKDRKMEDENDEDKKGKSSWMRTCFCVWNKRRGWMDIIFPEIGKWMEKKMNGEEEKDVKYIRRTWKEVMVRKIEASYPRKERSLERMALSEREEDRERGENEGISSFSHSDHRKGLWLLSSLKHSMKRSGDSYFFERGEEVEKTFSFIPLFLIINHPPRPGHISNIFPPSFQYLSRHFYIHLLSFSDSYLVTLEVGLYSLILPNPVTNVLKGLLTFFISHNEGYGWEVIEVK